MGIRMFFAEVVIVICAAVVIFLLSPYLSQNIENRDVIESRTIIDNPKEGMMAIKNQNHPEKYAGEVYLTNSFKGDLDDIGWKTKRAGTVALDIHGEPCGEAPDFFPVFVQRSELEASKYDIEIVDAPCEEATK